MTIQPKLCACGCGEPIRTRMTHAYHDAIRFRRGHGSRTEAWKERIRRRHATSARNQEIRARAEAGESHAALAREFDVTRQRVGQIVHGRKRA